MLILIKYGAVTLLFPERQPWSSQANRNSYQRIERTGMHVFNTSKQPKTFLFASNNAGHSHPVPFGAQGLPVPIEIDGYSILRAQWSRECC